MFRVPLKKEPEYPAVQCGISPIAPLSVSPGLKVWIPLGLLSVGFMISWISYVQWQSSISVHLQWMEVTLYAYSLLWTMNGAMIVLGQHLCSWFMRKFARTNKFIEKYESATRQDIDKLLLDTLSDALNETQKRKKITNLLYEMSSKDKIIKNTGSSKKSCWVHRINVCEM